MKKSDLKAGIHGVITRNGKRYVVCFSTYSETNFLLGNDSYSELSNYNDDLTFDNFSSLDIIKVFTLRASPIEYQILGKNIIWEESNKQESESKIRENEKKIINFKDKIEKLEEELKILKENLINE